MKIDLVRSSRDGDQFHYFWAASRCLKLLQPKNDLVAVSIEGASPYEQPKMNVIAGEEVIDIAEYFGSEDVGEATRVRYMQLKHSTTRVDVAWTWSELEQTLRKFAQRYEQQKKMCLEDCLSSKFEFWFVTNRKIGLKIRAVVEDVVNGHISRYPTDLKKLKKHTNLSGALLTDFCRMLHFKDGEVGYWEQRNLLHLNVASYLPGPDVDASTQLKELVTRKALSENAQNPIIKKCDVLRALKSDENQLFPAPNKIISVVDAIQREQQSEILASIVEANAPLVIHAAGGVGKSTFATQIGNGLPSGSVAIVYDCFGGGDYRSATGERHSHKRAFVQMANELAALSLCDPLVPGRADRTEYVRAFMYRLTQAADALRAATPDAILCVIVDAADNAQMVADEMNETRSFVRDLIKERAPIGVRLVFLCRSHRQGILEAPPNTIRIELRPFSRQETSVFLTQVYGNVADNDIDEFHRLSSQTPRVQALVVSRGAYSLKETLDRLGPQVATVDSVIAKLLDEALAQLKYNSTKGENHEIDRLCLALTLLRPMIPIQVLANMCEVESEVIVSFANDFGPSLLVKDNAIQFRDEPTETWFREKFQPTKPQLLSFVAILMPLAKRSVYIASVLPQLMLQAEQLSELVELALSQAGLPNGNELERRDVELKRLQYALKAALRDGRRADATKLAFKAGNVTAGDGRRRKLLRKNTDLASKFLPTDSIQQIASQGVLAGGWLGSQNVYEAAILSGHLEFRGDARGRLRMSHDWLESWTSLPASQNGNDSISLQDIAEIAFAELNVEGAEFAVEGLGDWGPDSVSWEAGRILVRRLIDHGRWSDLEKLAVAAQSNVLLVAAIVVELRAVHRNPPHDVLAIVVQSLLAQPVHFGSNALDQANDAIEPIVAIVEAALALQVCSKNDASRLLTYYLPNEPPRGLSPKFSSHRFPLLRGYCLRSALDGDEIEVVDLASSDLKKLIAKRSPSSHNNRLSDFEQEIGVLLPWHKLWSAVVVAQIDGAEICSRIEILAKITAQSEQRQLSEDSSIWNQVAVLWMDILNRGGVTDTPQLSVFEQWRQALKRPLFTPTIITLCRTCSQRPDTASHAVKYASEAYIQTKSDVETTAEDKLEEFIEIARAVLVVSRRDAQTYFDEAVTVASSIGDENLARWGALLDLANQADGNGTCHSEIAYRFARCAELTYKFVVRDKYFPWEETIVALCGLCPVSGITILSRWRDRGFGWSRRLLPSAVERLVQTKIIDPRDAIPLLGFRAEWDYGKILESICALNILSDERLFAIENLARHALLSESELAVFTTLNEVAKNHKIIIEDIDEKIMILKRNEASQNHDVHIAPDFGENILPWDEIFAANNLSTSVGLTAAYSSFKETKPPWQFKAFVVHAIKRVAVGAEIEFLKALINMPEFIWYHLEALLDAIPKDWVQRPVISNGLRSIVETVCVRNCLDIGAYRCSGFFPFALVQSLVDFDESEIIDVLLKAIGERPEIISPKQLFSLIGLLTTKLSNEEALNCFSFVLELFEPDLTDDIGDGPWDRSISPLNTVPKAIAGYLWAALAAPSAHLRWEGAHVVLYLCLLDRKDVLDELLNIAQTKSGGPYVDRKLVFYNLHGILWLLIGLARASLDAPKIVAYYSAELNTWAQLKEPHVLIRHFAARTLLQLISSGELKDEDGHFSQLFQINKSPFPTIESDCYERNFGGETDIEYTDEADTYFFGIDIGRYWYYPLARVFGLTQAQVEKMALKTIRDDLNYYGTGRWDDDERQHRQIYESRSQYGHQSSYPRTDNLQFYHSYHAMMIVAGRLLATTQTHNDPKMGISDEFADWLSRHDLTRGDGRWLWDRRDYEPVRLGDRPAEDSVARQPVIVDEFQQAIQIDDWVNLWGYWVEGDSGRHYSTRISSALVRPDKSQSLLCALSTAKNSHDYAIPTSSSDMEIQEGDFELTGWLVDDQRDRRLDEHDPWAGGIGFPPPYPAAFVVDEMCLQSDSDLRCR